MRKTIAFSALAVLTACGGGGGPVYVAPDGPPELVALYGESVSLINVHNRRIVAPFQEAGTPGESATFEGVMVVGATSPGTTYAGSVSLAVDFTSNGSMTGSANDFYVYDSSTGTGGAAVTGISDISIDAASLVGNSFPVTVGGQLGGTSIDGTLDGHFRALDTLAIVGADPGDTIDYFYAYGDVSLDGSPLVSVIRACSGGVLATC